jgi:hypothetical protein
MKLETSIMSQTTHIVGPVEHYRPVTSREDVRQLAALRLTGEGAGYALYPQSAEEEDILNAMIADEEVAACGYADGLPGYYQLTR